MKYEKFREANPDFQSRVGALTSGILSPDPKGITLLSMEECKAYTCYELYERVISFCDLDEDRFPITYSGIWSYCHGDPSRRLKGSLNGIGAVVELEIKLRETPYGPVYATAYEITDAGIELGRPIVARATYVVNELEKRKANYRSMWKILGSSNKSPEAIYRTGYARYRIAEFLSKHEKEKFRYADIIKALPELNCIVISAILNEWGRAGVIDYYSPHRDIEGKRARGWAKYKVTRKLDEAEIFAKAKKKVPYFHNWGCLKKVIGIINQNSGREYSTPELTEKLNIGYMNVVVSVSLLRKLGYIEADLVGGCRHSVVKTNELTKLLWEELFEPIGKVSVNLNPNITGFRDRLDWYKSHQEKWKECIRTQLMIYDSERTNIGKVGGKEVRRAILKVLPHGKKMKLSHISEKVNKISSRKLNKESIRKHLKFLIAEGKVKKVGRGHYTFA